MKRLLYNVQALKVGQEEQSENLQSAIQVGLMRVVYKIRNFMNIIIHCPFYQGLKISQKEQFEIFKKHQEEQNLKVIENLKQEIQVRTGLFTKLRNLNV